MRFFPSKDSRCCTATGRIQNAWGQAATGGFVGFGLTYAITQLLDVTVPPAIVIPAVLATMLCCGAVQCVRDCQAAKQDDGENERLLPSIQNV